MLVIILLAVVAAGASAIVAALIGMRMRSPWLAARLAMAGVVTFLMLGQLLARWPPLKPTFDLVGGTEMEFQVQPLQRGRELDIQDVADEAGFLVWKAGVDGVQTETAGEDRFVVKVPRSAESKLADIQITLQNASGEVLALRIVALPGRDDDLIDEGPFDPTEPIILEELGIVAAAWAPLDEGLFEDEENADQPQAYVRTHEGKRYVLLLHSRYDVTGEDIDSAIADVDSNLNPQVSFVLTSEGAERMGELTSRNLPEGQTYRQLAVVVDGVVVSAPRLMSTIGERGRITGDFTEEEVNHMVAMLSTGSLGAKVTLLGQQKVDADANAALELNMHLAVIFGVWLLIALVMTALSRPVGISLTAATLMQLIVMSGMLAIFDLPLTPTTCRGAALAVLFPFAWQLPTVHAFRARRRDGDSIGDAIREGCRSTWKSTLGGYLLAIGVSVAILLFADPAMRPAVGLMTWGGMAGILARFTLGSGLLELFAGPVETVEDKADSKPTALPS